MIKEATLELANSIVCAAHALVAIDNVVIRLAEGALASERLENYFSNYSHLKIFFIFKLLSIPKICLKLKRLIEMLYSKTNMAINNFGNKPVL